MFPFLIVKPGLKGEKKELSCGNKLERKNQYRGPLSISISKALGRVGEMVQRVRRLLHKLENPSSISRIHIRSWTW